MKKKDYYYDFLPSNLEIIEKNPSPLGGIIVYILSFFIIISIIMSMIFKMDVMITTTGVIDSQTGVNVINTNESRKIVNIVKKQGDYVTKDEVILEFEDTTAFEVNQVDKQIKRLEVEMMIVDSKISQKRNNSIFENTALEKNILEELKIEYNTYWNTYTSNIEEYNESIKSIDEEIAKNKESTTDVEAAKERNKNLEKRKKDLEKDFEESQSGENLNLIQQKNQINGELLEYRNQFDILQKDKKDLQVKSLIDGQISEANYSTVGEYIDPAKNIAKITPNDDEYIVKANIKNENISKVKKDQSVKLKVNSYDYQVYGFLKGTVVNVSENSVLNESTQTLEYPIEIEIDGEYDDKINLKSGMQVSMDIKVGRKSIFDYFTSPIRKTIDEAF